MATATSIAIRMEQAAARINAAIVALHLGEPIEIDPNARDPQEAQAAMLESIAGTLEAIQVEQAATDQPQESPKPARRKGATL